MSSIYLCRVSPAITASDDMNHDQTVALRNLDVLPFRAAALDDDAVEEEFHTLSGFGVSHHEILYPRGEMRLVASRPRKASAKAHTPRIKIIKDKEQVSPCKAHNHLSTNHPRRSPFFKKLSLGSAYATRLPLLPYASVSLTSCM